MALTHSTSFNKAQQCGSTVFNIFQPSQSMSRCLNDVNRLSCSHRLTPSDGWSLCGRRSSLPTTIQRYGLRHTAGFCAKMYQLCRSQLGRWSFCAAFMWQSRCARLFAGQKSIPSATGLCGIVVGRQLRRRRRDHDEVLTMRALNLFSTKAVIALNMLITMRAGEFEFAHKLVFLGSKIKQANQTLLKST